MQQCLVQAIYVRNFNTTLPCSGNHVANFRNYFTLHHKLTSDSPANSSVRRLNSSRSLRVSPSIASVADAAVIISVRAATTSNATVSYLSSASFNSDLSTSQLLRACWATDCSAALLKRSLRQAGTLLRCNARCSPPPSATASASA